MSSKFTYFRHSVNARNDDKLKEFSRLLGRKAKESYFYYFTLLELCASDFEDGKTEFKVHQMTLRTLWETNAKGVQTMCELLAKSALLMCEPCETYVLFTIPKLSEYLGSYETNKIKEKKRKINKIKENGSVNSPLNFLFNDADIKSWLDNGIHETHLTILRKFPREQIKNQIEKAFHWASVRNKSADTWLYAFVESQKNGS